MREKFRVRVKEKGDEEIGLLTTLQRDDSNKSSYSPSLTQNSQAIFTPAPMRLLNNPRRQARAKRFRAERERLTAV